MMGTSDDTRTGLTCNPQAFGRFPWITGTVSALSFYCPLGKDRPADLKMLSSKKKTKQRKSSLGFARGALGSVSDVENRVVMLCEDIPSEGSSWDSGRGSHSSGARSSGDELGHGWRSRSFHGRETQSMSSFPKPTKQYSVREIRHVDSSPAYGQNAGRSTLRIREMYENTRFYSWYHNDWNPFGFEDLKDAFKTSKSWQYCDHEVEAVRLTMQVW